MSFFSKYVISEKIYCEKEFLKLKSFLLSLTLHAAIVLIVLYSNISQSVPLHAQAKTVVISLSTYVLKQSVSVPAKNKKLFPKKNITKTTAKTEKLKKTAKIKTPEKILSDIKSKPKSSEAFTPQQSNAEPMPKEDSHKTNSSYIPSPSFTKELPTSSAQLCQIGNEELAQIRLMIENSLRYPSIAKKLKIEGVVVVSFSLNTDGYLENIHIVSSSGSSALDKKALQTVSSLDGEYPHLEKKVDLRIPIAFSLKKS